MSSGTEHRLDICRCEHERSFHHPKYGCQSRGLERCDCAGFVLLRTHEEEMELTGQYDEEFGPREKGKP